MIDPQQLEFNFNPPTVDLPQLWTPDDIYRHANEDVIRLFREDGRVERKPCGIHSRVLGDYVSMWANTQPHGGLVIIGVENDGSISGCKGLSTNELNDFETVRRYCSDARYEYQRVSVKNTRGEDDFVLFLRVYYRDDKLVETSDGNAYMRSGSEKRRLTESEKREIRISKGEIEYELEPVPLRWPEDFEQNLIDQLAASYRTKRRLTGQFKREDVLVLLHLGKKRGANFEPNLACALTLAKTPRSVIPGARLRISRYSGTEEQFGKNLNQTFDTFVDGPIPTQLIEADRYISPLIQNFSRLGSDNKFYTRPEYPHDVWFEAIVNACVHRSYNLKYMNVFIKMFDNKFVVESPGGFLPPTTAATVYESHNPRNPYVMEALYYLDFVHCAYEGTRRMRDSMKEANLPIPEFSQKNAATHVVHVTLKNNIEHRKIFLNPSVASLVGAALFETLTDHERMLINFVAEKDKISVSDAVRLIGKDWSAGKAILDGLVSRKILERNQKSGNPRDSSKRYILAQRGGKSRAEKK